MQIEKCTRVTKCDFLGCNNLADYCFSTKGVLRRELAFCKDCLKGMYEEIGKIQVPKATNSPFKLRSRIRKDRYEENN